MVFHCLKQTNTLKITPMPQLFCFLKCFETNLREVPQWVEDPENRLHTGQMGKYAAAQIVHGPLTRKADAACKCLAHHSEDIKYFKENKRGKLKFKKKNQQLYFKCHLNNQKKSTHFLSHSKQIHLLVLWRWCCYFQAAMSRHTLVTSVLLPSL